MELKDNLEKASLLKSDLDKLRPLSSEHESRILQKLRLEWNYNSTNIEGNSLTYGETKALILFGQTAQAKPLKDHLEISGHDEAIKYIEEVVKQERPLTESFIRELHEIILKEPYQVDAVTPDGKPTKKRIAIGRYKIVPNHVKTQTGEIFYFASPEETPAKMSDLMQWYSEEIKRPDVHPVILATEFHYRFIRIHPFDDGNGRIARLLMNFVLMQKGYPPAIIKTEEKKKYYNALEQADAGNLAFFFNFICEQVNNSLELMIRAAHGEEIEEADDLDKKLQLLKLKIGTDPNSSVKVKRSPDAVKSAIEKSLIPLIKELEKKLVDFDYFFKDREVFVEYKGTSCRGNNLFDVFYNICTNYIFKDLDARKIVNNISIKSIFKDLLNSKQNISVRGITFEIKFYQNVYEIRGLGVKNPINKLYEHFFEPEEIQKIVNYMGSWQYEELEHTINNIGY